MPELIEDLEMTCLVDDNPGGRKKDYMELLSAVHKNSVLYDPKNPEFGNVTARNAAWKNIGSTLDVDDILARRAWMELRYKIQKKYRSSKSTLTFKKKYNLKKCNKKSKGILHLTKFIKPIYGTKLPFDVQEIVSTDTVIPADDDDKDDDNDDDVEIIDKQPEIINIDDETERHDNFNITPQMKVLIDLVHVYGEIYNSQHRFYYDYKRKGNIWCAIANEIGDKATKLLKLWMYIEIRFEWEIEFISRVPSARATELTRLLWFLKPCYQKNNYSVYKQSHFLKKRWYEPIKSFKEIVQFLRLIKLYPEVVNITEHQIEEKTSADSAYIKNWETLAKESGMKAGICEITWLTLRSFYNEIYNMRKHGYLFQDKWFFEATIADILRAVPKFKMFRSPVNNTPNTNDNNHVLERSSTATENFAFVNVSATSNETEQTNENTQMSLKPASSITVMPITTVNVSITPNQAQNRISQFLASEVNTNETIAFGPEDFVPCADTTISIANKQATNLDKPAKTVKLSQPLTSAPIVTTIPLPPVSPTVTPSTNTQKPIYARSNGTSNQIINASDPLLSNNNKTVAKPLHTDTTAYQIPQDTNLKITNVVSLHTQVPQLKISSVTSLNANAKTDSNSHSNLHDENNLLQPLPSKNINDFNVGKPTTTNDPLSNSTYTEKIMPNHDNWQSYKNSMISEKEYDNRIHLSKRTALPVLDNDLDKESFPTTTILEDAEEDSTNLAQLVNENNNNHNKSTLNTNKTPMTLEETENTLNNNEIIIELVSSSKGNQLLVHGPPLAGHDYQLSMEQVSAFIREIMAIPQLHSKTDTNPFFWHHISRTCNLPANICKACWNFLSENFNHFHHFAPMYELMKPFKTELNVWTTSHELFKKFDNTAVGMGWLKYANTLPDVVTTISTYPNSFYNYKSAEMDKNYYQTWCEIRHIYPEINGLHEIWKAFRDVFWVYIMQLEKGIENRWAQNWWKVFYRMKFLVSERYNESQAFYYIVLNKIEEEARSCRLMEFKCPMDENLKRANRLHPLEVWELSNAVRKHSKIYLSNVSEEEKSNAWESVGSSLGKDAEECKQTFTQIYRSYKAYKAADTLNICNFNRSYYKILSDIDKDAHLKLKIRTPMELNQTVLEPPKETTKTDTEKEKEWFWSKSDSDHGVLDVLLEELGKFPSKVQDEIEYELSDLFKQIK